MNLTNLITSWEVRKLWNEFRLSKQHAEAKPVSLVASSENKSVLFNVAGMQQFVPYLVGKPHPLGQRLYNIQRCIRTNDIEDIGDERHLSMFEMMGNWSLGDYFKTEALTWTVEFLVDVLWIPKHRLGATIFAGDEATGIPRDAESYDILKTLGIEHISELWFDEHGDSDNFWTPWPIGPCGPCCEFYYDRWVDGELYIDPITGDDMASDWDIGVNDRYTEIWNNVFMCYYRVGSWGEKELVKTKEGVNEDSRKSDADNLLTESEIEDLNTKTYDIIGTAIELHKKYWNTLTEKQYQKILLDKLLEKWYKVESEKKVEIIEDGKSYGSRFIDLVIDDVVYIELKNTAHEWEVQKWLKQVKSYLNLNWWLVWLLLNFGTQILSKARVNNYSKENIELVPQNSESPYSPLPQKNVDTGMWFERLMMVLQGTETIFETDLFMPIIAQIESLTHTQYTAHLKAYRVILDHLRASIFLVADGVTPSNEGRGYILRRLIRRAYYYIGQLVQDHQIDMVKQILGYIQSHYVTEYPHIMIDLVSITSECIKFQRTLDQWRAMLEDILASTEGTIDGETVFKLYDTYGFPSELTIEIAWHHHRSVDQAWYESALATAKDRSRGVANFRNTIDWSKYLAGISETVFVWYDTLTSSEFAVLLDVDADGQRVIVLDRTVFYPEMGWQRGDSGSMTLPSGEQVMVTDTIKFAGVILHLVE